jgi:hypothetical protein
VYAFGEIPIIHRINPENLETEDRVDVSNFVSIVHHTAHPHVMSDGNSCLQFYFLYSMLVSGSVYNLGLATYSTGPYHIIVKFPPKEKGMIIFKKSLTTCFMYKVTANQTCLSKLASLLGFPPGGHCILLICIHLVLES